jgi:hypothetical protein
MQPIFWQQLSEHVSAATDMHATIEEQCFVYGPCREVMTRTVRAIRSVEFCTGGCEDRTWAHEAEDSPLLEAVAREWQVKTQQAGEGLAGTMMICELWR